MKLPSVTIDPAVVGRLLGLLVGTGLRSAGVLNEARTDRLNAAAYYVALTALVFVATYDRSIGELVTAPLVAGLLAVLFGTAAVAWVVHRNRATRARRSVAVVQSYHSNLGYLGLPLVAATFDAEVTATASVVLGVVSLTQVPLTVAVLSAVNGASTRIRDELRGIATNPVVGSLVAGLSVGSVGVSLPDPVVAGLDAVGALALPVALLCVGASLEADLPSVDFGATGRVTAVKVVTMPALAWGVFSALGVDAATFTAAVVMFGTPTAVSTFVFASELGGDEEFASLNVFVTTLASVGSLFLLISMVR